MTFAKEVKPQLIIVKGLDLLENEAQRPAKVRDAEVGHNTDNQEERTGPPYPRTHPVPNQRSTDFHGPHEFGRRR
jgi:hypothetical protein